MRRDWFSSLPDELIFRILALISTKESVFTTLLSSRWNRLFASVPSLHFDSREITYDDPGGNEKPDHVNFVKFVNGMLLVHHVTSIESFRVLSYHRCPVSDVISWIHAAIARSPRLIEIKITGTERCTLPSQLFMCQSLVELRVSEGRYELEIIDNVSLPSLKVLHMGLKIIDGESLKRLLSNCPVLGDLTLDRCSESDRKIKVFSISVPSLKRFTILASFGGWDWELNLPNLEYINCEPCDRFYSVSDLKSLHEAKIDLQHNGIRNGDDDRIWGIVNKLEEVRDLSLFRRSLQSLASKSFSMPMLYKVTTLKLKVHYEKEWVFFQTILKRSPCLEILVVDEGFAMNFGQMFAGVNKKLHKEIPLCFSQSLKEVQLCKFRASRIEY